MALSQKRCTLLLVVVAAVWIQLYQAQVSIGRCSCDENKIKFIKGNMSDFQVLERYPGCDDTELIVTMTNENSTEKFCIDTQGKMANAFLKCWERINKDESRKRECINNRKRKSE